MGAYGMSKSSNIMFTLELRKRLKGTGVLATSGHPGIINTELGRYSSVSQFAYDSLYPIIEKMTGKKILKDIPEGTSTTMCMVLHDLPDESGSPHDRLYLSDCVDPQNDPDRMYKDLVFNEKKAA